MLFDAAVVVVFAGFSDIAKPWIVTKSDPIILKIASLRFPAVRAELAVIVFALPVMMSGSATDGGFAITLME